jgi:hypothetical protein
VIISKNSQVGRGTIAGHHPPSGKHPNIIGGSVSGRDPSKSLKTSLKAHCPSGLRQAADICFEDALRPGASFPTALKACATSGRRSPTDAELALVFDHTGAPQVQQWVATHHRDANGTSLESYASTLEENSSPTIDPAMLHQPTWSPTAA